MSQLSGDQIESLLQELAEYLDFSGCPPVEWVICGGAAMSLLGLSSRTTRDVDVLGSWSPELGSVALLEAFPEEVARCIRQVAANHPELEGLKQSWVNLGPRQLVTLGLPTGFAGRLHQRKFGRSLIVRPLGRVDLLALKLYAAADRHGHRQEIHFEDLRALAATFDELDSAVDWVRTLPNFEEMRHELRTVVERLGHDDLAYYV